MTNFADQFKAAGVQFTPPQQSSGPSRVSSVLSTVETGTKQAGARVIISGVEKVGKTTLACASPRCLLVPLEMGFGSMPVAKTKLIESFDELMQLMEEIKTAAMCGQFPYMSLAFDSATAIEQLIHDAVLRSDPAYMNKNAKAVTMGSALGGYGKAFQFANELFGRFLAACDELAFYGGINIIVTCHVFAAKVIDPAHGEYDTWDLLLHSPKDQKNYGKREMSTQWADLVGFLHEPLFITKGETFNQASTMNQGRVLAVDRTPGYVAGNRYGMTGIIPIPRVNGWNAVAHAVYNASGIDIFNRDVT